ncbi:MAG: hypothetical protein JSV07_09445 [Acidimicrobiia bacterium]|nr:MAG: hypothetical protein JSV07_09445 [Acidimicrobiia bacterium]
MTSEAEGFEPGVGCRTAVIVLGFFVGLAVVGGVVFFTGDPESVSFWRQWVLGTTLPVSGFLIALGAGGLAWSLDLLLLVGVSVWTARPDDSTTVRRRAGLAVGVLALLGLLSATVA